MFWTVLLFIAKCLPVLAGLRLYDHYRREWELCSDPDTRDKLSKIWHATGFWMVALTALGFAFDHFTFEIIYEWTLFASVIVWIIYDLVWNRLNGQHWLYAGNGGGSFLEIFFTWLVNKLGFSITIWTLWWKLVLLIAGLVIAFNHNL